MFVPKKNDILIALTLDTHMTSDNGFARWELKARSYCVKEVNDYSPEVGAAEIKHNGMIDGYVRDLDKRSFGEVRRLRHGWEFIEYKERMTDKMIQSLFEKARVACQEDIDIAAKKTIQAEEMLGELAKEIEKFSDTSGTASDLVNKLIYYPKASELESDENSNVAE